MRTGQAPFSLQKRPSSKKEAEKKRQNKPFKYIYYVQFRDEDKNYTSALSTYQTSKGAAQEWAWNYIKKGKVPIYRGFTFSAYAKNWWIIDKCNYVAEKELSGHGLSPMYIEGSRRNVEKWLIPYFGHIKLTKIRFKDIMEFKKHLNKNTNLSPGTINRILATLKVMFKEALKRSYIQTNPCIDIGIIKEIPKNKTILSPDEVLELFHEDNLSRLWNNNIVQYTINILSASTGMRQGEILGLQRRHVHNGYIDVVNSWARKFGLKCTKNKEERKVPIPEKTNRYIKQVINLSPFKKDDDLVFYDKNRDTPYNGKKINDFFYEALQKLGISDQERRERNIVFHSWRKFVNTLCRNNSIPDYLIRIVLGHKLPKIMTDLYTDIKAMDLKPIKLLQEQIV